MTIKRTEDQELFRSSLGQYFEEHPTGLTEQEVRKEGGFLPVDMYETDNEIVIKAVIPGVTLTDIHVTLNANSLTIRTIIPSDATKEEARQWKWFHHELGHGPYSRTVVLPDGIDPEKAGATYDNGLLTITIYKSKAGITPAIEIKVAEKK